MPHPHLFFSFFAHTLIRQPVYSRNRTSGALTKYISLFCRFFRFSPSPFPSPLSFGLFIEILQRCERERGELEKQRRRAERGPGADKVALRIRPARLITDAGNERHKAEKRRITLRFFSSRFLVVFGPRKRKKFQLRDLTSRGSGGATCSDDKAVILLFLPIIFLFASVSLFLTASFGHSDLFVSPPLSLFLPRLRRFVTCFLIRSIFAFSSPSVQLWCLCHTSSR